MTSVKVFYDVNSSIRVCLLRWKAVTIQFVKCLSINREREMI